MQSAISPRIVHTSFDDEQQRLLQDRFKGVSHLSKELFTQKGEGDIADAVRAIALKHPKVHIGSYPNVDPSMVREYMVKVVATSRDKGKLEQVVEQLQPILL